MPRQSKPNPAMRALKATHDQARGGREAAEALAPLLTLLDPPEAGGALDELRGILEAILEAQRQTLEAIRLLAERVDGTVARMS